MPLHILRLAVVAIVALASTRAFCETGPHVAQAERTLGAGYKVGNGHGLYGGEMLARATPRLWFVLYAGATWEEGGKGLALVPTVQANLRGGDVSTPYASLGVEYATVRFDDVWAHGFGFLINAGYEWHLRDGLALQLGVGVRAMREVQGSRDMTTVAQPAFISPNAEIGLRYRFP